RRRVVETVLRFLPSRHTLRTKSRAMSPPPAYHILPASFLVRKQRTYTILRPSSMKHLPPFLAIALLPTCSFADPPNTTVPQTQLPAYRLMQCRTGKEMTLAQVAEELAARDVVYFGELHDNVVGHQVYAELAKLLAERRPDFALSMEMFERDVQGV